MMETVYQKEYSHSNKLQDLGTINHFHQELTNTQKPPAWMLQTRNYAQTYEPSYSSTKKYQSNYFNKINVKKIDQ